MRQVVLSSRFSQQLITLTLLFIFNLSLCFRYGDKSPKSYIARIFAVLWILLGITIFSMVTASLTNILHRASWEKTSVEVNGKTVTYLF